MRVTILLSVCVSLATTSLSNGVEFSQVRDLPALKLGATDLDAILLKTHALIDAANGPEDLGRETVKVSIDGQDIEIPHLSLASSVAFPNEVFGFSYMYNQADKPISSVTIDLGDSLRRVSVSGESAEKVDALSKLLEKDFRRYSTRCWWHEISPCNRDMPFDVVFDIAHDQQRVLLEQSKPQGVGDADLFCGRLFASTPCAVEQVASRVCPLSTLFAFLSHQACVSDLSPRASCSSYWNSRVVFSFAKRAVAILFALPNARSVFRLAVACRS